MGASRGALVVGALGAAMAAAGAYLLLIYGAFTGSLWPLFAIVGFALMAVGVHLLAAAALTYLRARRGPPPSGTEEQ